MSATISTHEWAAKLAQCKTPADVHELNAGRTLLQEWDLLDYQTAHRQMAAQRSAELTKTHPRR